MVTNEPISFAEFGTRNTSQSPSGSSNRRVSSTAKRISKSLEPLATYASAPTSLFTHSELISFAPATVVDHVRFCSITSAAAPNGSGPIARNPGSVNWTLYGVDDPPMFVADVNVNTIPDVLTPLSQSV